MTIKTTRYMTSDKVRTLCIVRGYCTKSDVEEYVNLLQTCQGAVSDDDVLRIAELIMSYSDVKKLACDNGRDETELLESICFNLINECAYSIIELAERENMKKVEHAIQPGDDEGVNRQWVDIVLFPLDAYSIYDGKVYSYTTADDAANAVIGVDRENGYRFCLTSELTV